LAVGLVILLAAAGFFYLQPKLSRVDPAITAREAIDILARHDVQVQFVDGWETRSGSVDGTELNPEAVVVHHTASDATPVELITDGTDELAGPLANWFVDSKGRIFLVASGYSNNAGYGGEENFSSMKSGQIEQELPAPPEDGDWSANSHAWAIEASGAGKWTKKTRASVVKLTAALHLAQGWEHARVIGHKELTTRKPVDPEDDMGKLRRDVLKQIGKWK
jgi:hypothetical protein